MRDSDTKRVRRLRELYDTPVAFWRELLGPALHFHVGHFLAPGTSLVDAQAAAVATLAAMLPDVTGNRILDLGAGWGGPAFQLAALGAKEVIGITISGQQAAYINQRAAESGLPIRAMVADLERASLKSFGKFDLLWVYESLEHIRDRRRFFKRLTAVADGQSHLAIAVACRSAAISKLAFDVKDIRALDTLAIQPLDTLVDLVALVEGSGWEIRGLRDVTALTLPTWSVKLDRLRQVANSEFTKEAARLAEAFATTGRYFQGGSLRAIQLSAERWTGRKIPFNQRSNHTGTQGATPRTS